MFQRVFETYRKTSESWLQMQQDTFRHLSQQWLVATPNVAGAASDWHRNFQRQSLDLAVDILNAHRHSLNAAYKTVIDMLQQSSRISEAKTTEEQRRAFEELWRCWLEAMKSQSESQLRELQSWAGKSLEIVQNAQV